MHDPTNLPNIYILRNCFPLMRHFDIWCWGGNMAGWQKASRLFLLIRQKHSSTSNTFVKNSRRRETRFSHWSLSSPAKSGRQCARQTAAIIFDNRWHLVQLASSMYLQTILVRVFDILHLCNWTIVNQCFLISVSLFWTSVIPEA